MSASLVRAGSALLAVDRWGEGEPPVVCLHAGVADRRMWSGLAAGRAIVAYDRRGFGDTTAEQEPWSPVEDLVAVLDALHIERAALLGCSQGGRLALDAALAHPHRVCALLLVAPAVSGAPEPAAYSPAVAELAARIELAEQAGDLEQVNALEARLWLDGPEAPEGRVSGATRELLLEMNRRALSSPPPGPARWPEDTWARLAEISQPCALLWGELDLDFVKDRCEIVSRRIPTATAERWSGAAHLPNLEDPPRFARWVERNLGR